MDYSPGGRKESDTIERLTPSLTHGLLIVPIIQKLKLSQLMFIASVSSQWNSLVWKNPVCILEALDSKQHDTSTLGSSIEMTLML